MDSTPPTPTVGRRNVVNLKIDDALLAEAKSLGINISRTLEHHLQQVVRQEKERQWKERNARFVDQYNSLVERDGSPLDQWRQF